MGTLRPFAETTPQWNRVQWHSRFSLHPAGTGDNLATRRSPAVAGLVGLSSFGNEHRLGSYRSDEHPGRNRRLCDCSCASRIEWNRGRGQRTRTIIETTTTLPVPMDRRFPVAAASVRRTVPGRLLYVLVAPQGFRFRRDRFSNRTETVPSHSDRQSV